MDCEITIAIMNDGGNSANALEVEANARLIAAAPDLLAALIALSGNIGAASLARNKHGQMLRANAEAAIAKALAAATGEGL